MKLVRYYLTGSCSSTFEKPMPMPTLKARLQSAAAQTGKLRLPVVLGRRTRRRPTEHLRVISAWLPFLPKVDSQPQRQLWTLNS